MQHWYMQLILVFCCTRSADELAFIEHREITPIPPNKLRYKPLHVIKNATLDSHYNLVTKQDMDIVSKECFDFHHVLLSKRHPGEWEKNTDFFLNPFLKCIQVLRFISKERIMVNISPTSVSRCMPQCCRRKIPIFRKVASPTTLFASAILTS